MVSFAKPFPERLSRGPRCVTSAHLRLELSSSSVSTRGASWLESLGTVLNMVHHDAEVLDAIERGERAIIFNQGMVFVENDLSEADAEDRAVWLAHTGAELEGPLFTLSPTWLSCPANVLPRDEVIALLGPMVEVCRQRRFPWLFGFWPCATEPAPGEEALLRILEARAGTIDDELRFECNALGFLLRGTETRAAQAKRRALARFGLPRLGALLDASLAQHALAGDRDRFAESQNHQRPEEPPFSLRYFLGGPLAPEGVSLGRWVGACEVIVRRIPAYPMEPGAEGEWVVSVLGQRVALRFAMEHGMPMITGWRVARAHEPETPLLAEPDDVREEAMWRESRRLFVRPDVIRPTPTAVDLAYLRWLDAAWSEAVSGHGGSFDAALGPRRAMLLGELEAAGILDAREPMIALLAARGHTGLIRAGDAVRELLRYLKSPERRAHTGCGYYGLVAGAWVSPFWFLHDDPAVHDLDFTARCEAALHDVHLGTAGEGEVEVTIDGVPRIVVWRRETGLFPALTGVSASFGERGAGVDPGGRQGGEHQRSASST
jgi:hypothetical protein